MKIDNIKIIIIVILLAIFVLMLVNKTTVNLNTCVPTVDSLELIIYKQDSILHYRDSLYWNHISNCSFINREDISIDANGYFKIKSQKERVFDLYKE